MVERVLYRRADGKWAWQLIANGDIIATDGGRGFASQDEARLMADSVIRGDYRGAQPRVVSHISPHLRASGED
jgi:uncharacterized protein YegP (UPF0339 family)